MIPSTGRCQHDDLAAARRLKGMREAVVDRASNQRTVQDCRAIASDDAAGESLLPESQSKRSANQAGADDRDLANGHQAILRPTAGAIIRS